MSTAFNICQSHQFTVGEQRRRKLICMRRLINERVSTSNNLASERQNELKGTLADHERSLVSIKLPNLFL